ncbi:MAG: amino acid-binding protein [Acidimicrobiales bacterium]
MSYRVRARIEFPDVPGGLAAVATVLARVGADVLSVDVHPIRDGRVCDELVLDLPDHLRHVDIATSLAAAGAGSLVGFWPGDRAVDPYLLALRSAGGIVGVGGSAAEEQLTQGLARVCATSAVWILDVSAASASEPGRTAVAQGRAVVVRTSDVPARLAPGPTSEWWLLAVPDAHDGPRRVGFVARPVGHRFTPKEIARVEALLDYARLVENHGLLGDPQDSLAGASGLSDRP